MLIKLAFKNVGKSVRDYAVYFITLALGVCVFYMFNSIYAQQEIMTVTESLGKAMTALRRVLSYISVFVAIVLGFLIVYANNFFIKRRKKEIGVYLTLGMSKFSVSLILILETSLLAILALVVGLFCGVWGSQAMSLFTAKIFEADLSSLRFVFSADALWKSVLYFGVIFLVVIVFNIRTIGKCPLLDLLRGSRTNEVLPVKFHTAVAMFLSSVACLSAAYALILWNGMTDINVWFSLALILGTAGTLLFFLSCMSIVTRYVQSRKSLYYKNLNLFVVRQLSSKIHTNYLSISVVCIVLLLAIGIFSCGYGLQDVVSDNLRTTGAYDFTISRYTRYNENPIWPELGEKIRQFAGIQSHQEVKLYGTGEDFNDVPVDLSEEDRFALNAERRYISLSDYNALRSMKGQPAVTLAPGTCRVVFNSLSEADQMPFYRLAQMLSESGLTLSLHGQELRVDAEYDQFSVGSDGGILLLVAPDEVLDTLNPTQYLLNILCVNQEAEEDLRSLLDTHYENNDPFRGGDYISCRLDAYETTMNTKVIVAFLSLYLGTVFMIVCAAILAIQQLSEAEDNRERYALLRELGVDNKTLHKALFQQILCYFAAPLSLALIHSVVGLKAASDAIFSFSQMNLVSSLATTACFIVAIYGVYFILTYLESRSIVDRAN